MNRKPAARKPRALSASKPAATRRKKPASSRRATPARPRAAATRRPSTAPKRARPSLAKPSRTRKLAATRATASKRRITATTKPSTASRSRRTPAASSIADTAAKRSSVVSISSLRARKLLAMLNAAKPRGGRAGRWSLRYATRIEFSMRRLDELTEIAERDGGVFAPARVEVAASILQVHLEMAARFLGIGAQLRQRRAA